MMVTKRTVLSLSLMLAMMNAAAQPSLTRMQDALGRKGLVKDQISLVINPQMPAQASLFFSSFELAENNLVGWLSENLGFRPQDDKLTEKGQPADYFGNKVKRYQQYYKGIKVEHGVISATVKEQKVRMLQLEYYSLADSLNVYPGISADLGFQKAIAAIGAKKYVWEGYSGTDTAYAKPQGELVIVEDISGGTNKMVLAYKFRITAVLPFRSADVFIDAKTGKAVLINARIYHTHNQKQSTAHVHSGAGSDVKSGGENTYMLVESQGVTANTPGTAQTLYSGNRAIVTDQFGATFRLRETRNGHNIITKDYLGRSLAATGDALAIDFMDADNNWTALEHDNQYKDIAALDVHWGLEKVSDYWATTHTRSSYDNLNSDIKAFVHVKREEEVEYQGATYQLQLNDDNAYWWNNAMYYGDGTYYFPNNNPIFPDDFFYPVVSLDITAHEFGHGINDHTAQLIYERESGALNEGFSDIWAACVENFVNPILTTPKQPFKIGEDFVPSVVVPMPVNPYPYLRNMQNPHEKFNPDTYQDPVTYADPVLGTIPYWRDVTPEPNRNNDYSGVHFNSGVLGKWFALLTMGGIGTNGNGYTYNISGLGFQKTERLAYFTEINLTPNANYFSARTASINAAKTLLWSQNDLITLNKAWAAVGLIPDSVFNTTNSNLTTNIFTSINVGKDGYIWAGTSNAGLFKYNDTTWQKSTLLTNHNIADIKPDANGGIWIAQYGSTGAQAIGGGIYYFPDTSFTNYTPYNTTDGIVTRNVRSLFVNNFMTNPLYPYSRIWTANFAHTTGGVSATGGVTRGNPAAGTKFLKLQGHIDNALNTGGTFVIGGSPTEVWAFASNNYGHNQIVRYDINTVSTTAYLGYFDETNSDGVLPAGYNVKAIYYDPAQQIWWVGVSSGGVYIYDQNAPAPKWKQVNFTDIFPAGTLVNNNAISGDNEGNVYIGTTNGMVLYKRSAGTYTDLAAYKRFTKADHFLPSNNIRSVAVDAQHRRLLIATDNGIAFRYYYCQSCEKLPAYTVAAGDWNDPSIWTNGIVPDANTPVVIKHAVTVNSNVTVKALEIQTNGSLNVTPGINVTIQ